MQDQEATTIKTTRTTLKKNTQVKTLKHQNSNKDNRDNKTY